MKAAGRETAPSLPQQKTSERLYQELLAEWLAELEQSAKLPSHISKQPFSRKKENEDEKPNSQTLQS